MITLPPNDLDPSHQTTPQERKIITKIQQQDRYRETIRLLDNGRVASMLENLADNLQPLSEEVVLLQEAAVRLNQFVEISREFWFCANCRHFHPMSERTCPNQNG